MRGPRIIPAAPDQAFWDSQVATLGAGPDPIPLRRVTSDRLASAISRAATDVEMHKSCRELGDKISAEDGVGRAVDAFEEHVGKRRQGDPTSLLRNPLSCDCCGHASSFRIVARLSAAAFARS